MTIYTNCVIIFYAYYKVFCCYNNMFPLISMSNCLVVVTILEFWSIHLISLLIFMATPWYGNRTLFPLCRIKLLQKECPLVVWNEANTPARPLNKTSWMPRPRTGQLATSPSQKQREASSYQREMQIT
jgi:hypothetical protein